MKNIGVVKQIEGRDVLISVFKESSCSHCNKCGDEDKISRELKIKIADEVEIGDFIEFEIENKKVFIAAMVVYIVPVFIMIAGYFMGLKIFKKEGMAVLSAFISLAISFSLVYIYDKLIVKNKMVDIVKIISITKKESK